MRYTTLLILLLTSLAATADSPRVADPWIRAMPPGQPNSAAYLELYNDSSQTLRLVGGRSNRFRAVEIHESSQVNGNWRMRRLEELVVDPGDRATLKPGAAHLMLFGVTSPLVVGEIIPLQLQFDDGSALAVEAEVRRQAP